ncbi:hypothetical protein [Deinococcus arenicola]|uniref:Uncharacterized protein n=1 Tax=Deinococcus arenicola TaxID=2994950 RepID=A0ABU4DW17_9DEIO|nr:hypothetical protein [Deinococcus sp. ZS9-10]MDV6376643.1 hypothetical protein [Deinococcus sp. ZS9-10]
MNLGLDGLVLGPLNLSWQSLTLLLGLDGGRPLLENVLDIVDIRRGSWAWFPGLLAGLAAL